MRLPRPKLPTLIFLILLLILAVRMAWRVSRTETGWEMLAEHWQRTLIRFVAWQRPELANQDPADQARFWLAEVERVPATTNVPQVAVGAAWVLDSPQPGFMSRHLRLKNVTVEYPDSPPLLFPEMNWDTVARAFDDFDDLCLAKCLASIQRAIELDPANVEVWRARALLLFRSSDSQSDEPRRADWMAVLDECVAHDPDNALYHYLAAAHNWKKSAIRRWDAGSDVLEVTDRDGFERGNQQFAMGLTKSRLMFGADGYADMMSFVERSTLSKMDRLSAAEGREIGSRAFRLLIDLLRYQQARHEVQRRNEQMDAAAATLRTILTVAGQISKEGNPPLFIFEPLYVRKFGLANLTNLENQAPERFGVDAVEAPKADLREVRLEMEIVDTAGKRLNIRNRPRHGLTDSVASSIAVVVQPLAEILLVVAFCVWGLAWLIGKNPSEDPQQLGLVEQIAAWVSGLGLSFVVFGLCPADIISAEAQTRVLRGSAWLSFAALPAGMLYVLQRKLRIGFGQLLAVALTISLPWTIMCYWESASECLISTVAAIHPLALLPLALGAVTIGLIVVRADVVFARRTDLTGRRKAWLIVGLSMLSMFVVFCGAVVASFAETNIESKVWVASRVWSEASGIVASAQDLRTAMKLESRPWVWSLLQWDAYSGMYLGSLLSALILTVLFTIRRCRQVEGGLRSILRKKKREHLRLVGVVIARPLFCVGACLLLIYLAAAPSTIDEREGDYQRRHTRLVDPAAASREFEAEIAAIRNDFPLMTELRQKVKANGE